MPSLRASEQGSEVRAHLQVRQCPTGKRGRERLNANVANLVAVETKLLHIAHHTKRLSQESAHAKFQGQGTRQ